ncbi:MAG: type II secretion system F family protein [Kineosporiaceae bacterium]
MDAPGAPAVAALLGAAALGLLRGRDPVARLCGVATAGRSHDPVPPGPTNGPTAGSTRRPAGQPAPEPVVTDLVAAALLSGLPPADAVNAVADALEAAADQAATPLRALVDRSATPLGALADPSHAVASARPKPSPVRADPFAALAEALDLAVRTGLGPVPLVEAAAVESRRRRAARRQVAARRLGTLVVLPTGLCLLPAFVLLTVAPLVLDLLLG